MAVHVAETLLPILWCLYPEVELLGHLVMLFLSFEEVPCCFPQHPHRFTPPPAVPTVPLAPRPRQHWLFSAFLVVAIPTRGLDLHVPEDR